MKYLKIESNKAYFLKEIEGGQADWTLIELLDKESLLILLNKAINTDFEMDQFNEEILSNKAHQIIYKHLHEKFLDLIDNKTRFKDESEGLYKSALEKYKVDA